MTDYRKRTTGYIGTEPELRDVKTITSHNNWTLESALFQLEFCKYSANDGINELQMNDAFIWLKEQAAEGKTLFNMDVIHNFIKEQRKLVDHMNRPGGRYDQVNEAVCIADTIDELEEELRLEYFKDTPAWYDDGLHEGQNLKAVSAKNIDEFIQQSKAVNEYGGCEKCGTMEAVAIHEDEDGNLNFICEKCLCSPGLQP